MSIESLSLHPFQENVAMRSPEHMLHWLQETGRKWLVFNTEDMVRGQVWPHGIDALMQIISGYRQHRQAQPSGRFDTLKHPVTREMTRVPITKTDKLEIAEMDRAIRWLIEQITEADPDWSLNKPAL